MRRSKPGEIMKKRNQENEKANPAQNGEKTTGKHYPMTYGRSLRSGRTAGGMYWNPPKHCEKRMFIDEENRDVWIDVNICKACELHRKDGCEAFYVATGYRVLVGN